MDGIEIYFRDELLCRGFLDDGKVEWEGDPAKYNYIVGYYQQQGYEGEQLLQILLQRLKGNTWAKPLS